MKKLILFLCLPITLAAQTQKLKTEDYIETYKEIAIKEMMRTGVPAAITLAQGILESQSGQSNLVKNSNNHFGIKCKTEWTGDKTYHDDDAKGECFRVYNTPEESYVDHSDFLKTRAHYAFLFKLDPTDFEGWAKGLKKAGYATNPAYPQRLMKLINDYNLQQYSLQAIARLNNEGNIENTTVLASRATTETQQNNFIQTKAVMEPVKIQTAAIAETTVTASLKKDVSYPEGIFTINHAKVIYGKAGTSLLSLANTYDLPLSKLIEYNDIEEMEVLDMDRLVFIEKKQKKGATDFHIVTEGETLHHISQIEGIRLENLLAYNNNLKKGTSLYTGNKIYLRTPSQSSAAKSAKGSRRSNGK